MTLEIDHDFPPSFTWSDGHWQHFQYIAENDPDDDYYHPSSLSSAVKQEHAVKEEHPVKQEHAVKEEHQSGSNSAGPSSVSNVTAQADNLQQSGITWPELKHAIKYQLKQIMFDLPASLSSNIASSSSRTYPPNNYGYVVPPEGAAGLSVQAATKAKGRGFPVKPIPSLHPAAARLSGNARFFPPYPDSDAEQESKRTTGDVSVDGAGKALDSRFTSSSRSAESSSAIDPNGGALGLSSAPGPFDDATGHPGFEVKPADEASFFPAKTAPPKEGFGSWGKRYAGTDEVKREYNILCGMLDEFDDAGLVGIPPSSAVKKEEDAASTSTAQPSEGMSAISAAEKASPPFTIQRICELILDPHKHYVALPKFAAAMKRTLAVTAGKKEFPACHSEDDGQDMFMESAFSTDALNGKSAKHEPILNGSATPRPATRTYSRTSTPGSPALRPYEPLWSPIPFLLRQEAEERERLATEEAENNTRLEQQETQGPGGEYVKADERASPDQKMDDQTSSPTRPVDGSSSPSNITPSASSTVAAATAAGAQETSIAGGSDMAKLEPPQAPPTTTELLGVPTGRVDELDDISLRGKGKGGLPGLDVEMQPISVTTTSSSSAREHPEGSSHDVSLETVDSDLQRQVKRARSDASLQEAGEQAQSHDVEEGSAMEQ